MGTRSTIQSSSDIDERAYDLGHRLPPILNWCLVLATDSIFGIIAHGDAAPEQMEALARDPEFICRK